MIRLIVLAGGKWRPVDAETRYLLPGAGPARGYSDLNGQLYVGEIGRAHV
jgi:hypothetical protein